MPPPASILGAGRLPRLKEHGGFKYGVALCVPIWLVGARDALLQQYLGDDRRHAPRPPSEDREGREMPPPRETRDVQPRREREGSDCPHDDGGRRAERSAEARRDDHRADEREHG